MDSHQAFWQKALTSGLIVVFSFSRPAFALPQSQTDANPSAAITASSAEKQSPSSAPSTDPLPDSPSAIRAQPPKTLTIASSSARSAEPIDSSTQAQDPQTSSDSSQQAQHEPVGTAAAPSVPVLGVAASRPAGAALAPGKQRRVRSILIKMGVVVGVGVAAGVTMALSEGSPSRPPGAK